MNAANAADQVSADETLRKLRAYLARGDSLRAAADAAGLTKSTAQRLAARHKLPRRTPPKRLTTAEKRKIQRDLAKDGATLRRIAAAARRGKSTIQRLANPVEPGDPKRVRPYRCPLGHRTYLKPCQTCRALGAGRVGQGTADGRS